jgi:hypothetical protein
MTDRPVRVSRALRVGVAKAGAGAIADPAVIAIRIGIGHAVRVDEAAVTGGARSNGCVIGIRESLATGIARRIARRRVERSEKIEGRRHVRGDADLSD